MSSETVQDLILRIQFEESIGHSIETAELDKALFLAKNAMGGVNATGKNTHFKSTYATYEDMVHATAEALFVNALDIEHLYHKGEGMQVTFITRVRHVPSGQWRQISAPLKFSDNPQDNGKLTTYTKRYAYSNLLNLITSDDDDGESIAQKKRDLQPLMEKQYQVIDRAIQKNPVIERGLKEALRVENLSQITQGQYQDVMKLLYFAKEIMTTP